MILKAINQPHLREKNVLNSKNVEFTSPREHYIWDNDTDSHSFNNASKEVNMQKLHM